MDMYFVVGELSFPPGVAARWRASTVPATKRFPKGTTIDDVLARAEGPVRLALRGDEVSVRAFLVDAAYFMVRDELEAALTLAGTMGARGRWYSGDHQSGEHAVLPGARRRADMRSVPEVVLWTQEAVALDEVGAATPRPDSRQRARPDAPATRAVKKTARKPPSAEAEKKAVATAKKATKKPPPAKSTSKKR